MVGSSFIGLAHAKMNRLVEKIPILEYSPFDVLQTFFFLER